MCPETHLHRQFMMTITIPRLLERKGSLGGKVLPLLLYILGFWDSIIHVG